MSRLTKTKLRILQHIGDSECNPQELARKMNISKSAISQHLSVLLEEGYVTLRVEGRNRFYKCHKDILEKNLNSLGSPENPNKPKMLLWKFIKNRSILGLGTTISVILCLGVTLRYCNGKNAIHPANERPISARTLFKFGAVKTQGQLIKRGFEISSGQLIQTDSQSFCDLKFEAHDSDSRILFSQESNSEMQYTSEYFNSYNTLKLWLNRGQFYLNTAIEYPDRVLIITPDLHISGMAHSNIKITVSNKGTHLTVIKGQVHVRTSYSFVDDIMNEIWYTSKGLRRLKRNLDISTRIIGPNASVLFRSTLPLEEQEDSIAIAQKELLSRASRSLLNDNSDIQKLSESIDHQESGLNEIQVSIQSQSEEIPLPTKLSDRKTKKLQEFFAQFASQTNTEKDNLNQDHVSYNKKEYRFLMERISTCMDREIETLVLKDSTRITGVIESDSHFYWVLNPGGMYKFPRNTVDRVDFR